MPRRSSPTVIAEIKTGLLSLETRRKNARTPRLALVRFLAPLVTLVSIKYMSLFVKALEILVLSDIRHRGQGFRKALLLGSP